MLHIVMTNSPILPFHNAFVVCITHNVSLPPIYHDFLHHLKDYRALLDFTIMTICHTTISFFPVQGSLLINFWMWPALTVASISKGFRSPVKKNKPQFWISWSLSNSLSFSGFRNNVFHCIESKTRFIFWISLWFLLTCCGSRRVVKYKCLHCSFSSW